MVVPKGQAEVIYKIIRDRGGVVEYKRYPDEVTVGVKRRICVMHMSES